MMYHDLVIDNYAMSLESQEVIRTFYPQTRFVFGKQANIFLLNQPYYFMLNFREGVVNIVQMAAEEHARVRVSGLKHTWNHWLWGVDNQMEELDTDKETDVDYYIAMVYSS